LCESNAHKGAPRESARARTLATTERHSTADEIAAIATTTNVILAPPPTETAFT
jgi:hypothetical protein